MMPRIVHLSGPMTRRPWTEQELATLRALYPDMTAKTVARRLGRSVLSVYGQANALDLRKSAAFWASDRTGRVQRGLQDPRTRVGQFKPGLIPWNKGKPGSSGHHPNTRKNQFKPGRKPEEARNYLPIGSERLNHDGVLERKMSDDTSVYPARRWTPVHRLVWEAAYGPVPRGSVVVFKPGQRTTSAAEITLDRLECITRRELVKRNSVHQRPELKGLYQLKGAITRQVNRITREAESRQGTTP
ncbi:MAG: HNH endonuclease [Comamonas sp.]